MKNTSSPSKYSPSMYFHNNQINLKGTFNLHTNHTHIYRILLRRRNTQTS